MITLNLDTERIEQDTQELKNQHNLLLVNSSKLKKSVLIMYFNSLADDLALVYNVEGLEEISIIYANMIEHITQNGINRRFRKKLLMTREQYEAYTYMLNKMNNLPSELHTFMKQANLL